MTSIPRNPTASVDLKPRIAELERERFVANARRVDRMFAVLMVAQWVFAIAIALLVSPHTWVGTHASVHVHVYAAIFLGALLSSAPIFLAITRPGSVVTRNVIAVAQMLWSALLIHLTGGRIETHFHVFGSLAFLAFYRDWKVLVPATVIVASDHLLRQLFWPESVFGISTPEWYRFLEHGGWVAFEDIFLFIACIASNREMRQLAVQQVNIEMHDREAAAKLQTSILPNAVSIAGLETAASMQPAELVGGDYYDVIPTKDGCWIAIGDVAGHGMQAGLTMLQVQSAFSALVRYAPDASPAEVWAGLNRTYFANVRGRLGRDDYMTLSLLRYHADGRVEMYGAHEELVIYRAAKQTCEIVPVDGVWIGVTERPPASAGQVAQLEVGDVLVLYTDGIIEAKTAAGTRVGLDRLVELVDGAQGEPVDALRDTIMRLVDQGSRDDDASVIVMRYVGTAATLVASTPARAAASA